MAGWFTRENPTKIKMIWGHPYFRKSPYVCMYVYIYIHIIPSPVHTKHPPNDPNGMWKFPTSTMV